MLNNNNTIEITTKIQLNSITIPNRNNYHINW